MRSATCLLYTSTRLHPNTVTNILQDLIAQGYVNRIGDSRIGDRHPELLKSPEELIRTVKSESLPLILAVLCLLYTSDVYKRQPYSHPSKLIIALAVRQSKLVPYAWISNRLHMGIPKSMGTLLHRAKKMAETDLKTRAWIERLSS